jgi:hypothetical protein
MRTMSGLAIRLSSGSLAACVFLTGCTRADLRQTARPLTDANSALALAPSVTAAAVAPRAFSVPIAAAILLTRDAATPRWCVAFADTTLAIGDTVTLVWPDEQEGAPTLRALVRRVRRGQCPPALSLMGDTLGAGELPHQGAALELAPADSAARRSGEFFPIAVAIGNGVPWVRGADHLVRADVDGDGLLELVRSCASSEGLHLTVWTVLRPTVAPDSGETPRWHSYHPLGYDVEPNCTARETSF